MKIDLHIHSHHSVCGDQTVKELLDDAKSLGVGLISLTDHDSVAGVDEALSYGKAIGVQVVPGIEISASTGPEIRTIPLNSKIHILGYNIDHRNPILEKRYDSILPKMKARTSNVISYLNNKGCDLDFDAIQEYKEVYIIRQLISKGYCPDRKTAKRIVRTKEINERFPEVRFSLAETIDLILELGGIPVLAHAYRGPNRNAFSDAQVNELISVAHQYGLKGLETHHYFHLEDNRAKKLLRICKEMGLFSTMGSDHHSRTKVYDGMTDDRIREMVMDANDFNPKGMLKALNIQDQNII